MYAMTTWFVVTVVLTANAQAQLRHRRAFGAGYAFPPVSQNDAINELRRVNPSIDWDRTSFLSNKASSYAECTKLGTSYSLTGERTSDWKDIGLILDYTRSRGSDTGSVSSDIKIIIADWISTGQYNHVIRGAQQFGCSVRPECSGSVLVACLFSPAYGSTVPPPPPPPPPSPGPCHEYGKAMSQTMYKEVEAVTGAKWDRKLENIAGHDIDCNMRSDWPYTCAKNEAHQHGESVTGFNGVATLRGNTDNTVTDIINGMSKVPGSHRVGCSFIPDCPGRQVVVSCLYETRRSHKRQYNGWYNYYWYYY